MTALANNQLVGYGYDAAGNMTHDATTGAQLFQPHHRGSWIYLHLRRRWKPRREIKRQYRNPELWAIFPAHSSLSMSFFDGERVARKDFPGNSVFYYFSDQLKTAVVVTDSAGHPTEVPYAIFGNPQSLNLYSYTKNNPTTFGDPDGVWQQGFWELDKQPSLEN